MAKKQPAANKAQPKAKSGPKPKGTSGTVRKTVPKSPSKGPASSAGTSDKDLVLLYLMIDTGECTANWDTIASQLEISKLAAKKRFSRLKERMERVGLLAKPNTEEPASAGVDTLSQGEIEPEGIDTAESEISMSEDVKLSGAEAPESLTVGQQDVSEERSENGVILAEEDLVA